MKESMVIYEKSVRVGFVKQDNVIDICYDGFNIECLCDIDWFMEKLDNLDILRNFIYVFCMFDCYFRYNLVSCRSQIGQFEDISLVKGDGLYIQDHEFEIRNDLAFLQTKCYCNLLESMNIRLEKVFQWLFETHLPKEVGVDGFYMSVLPNSATCLDKCISLLINMEGLLKRFKLFVQEGKIDQKLLEVSSEHLFFENIPSFIPKKYVYPCSERIKRAMNILCVDLFPVSYTLKTGPKYKTLYHLLKDEVAVKLSDFKECQIPNVQFLIDMGIVLITQDDLVSLDEKKAFLLYDLYEHDVFCAYCFPFLNSVIDEMISSGDLIAESKLFSRPEKDYLNYMLNQADFSNGLDIRNKYVHGIYLRDTSVQQRDYVYLLNLMILVITKIMNEFSARDLLNKREPQNKAKD